MTNRITAAEVCDATEDDSSNDDDKQKNYLWLLLI